MVCFWFTAVAALLIALVLCLAMREAVGGWISGIFPKSPVKAGDGVDIFLNGKYNRTATITGIAPDGVFIYNGKLRLPLDYRGRFYATGVDESDGSVLVYVGNRRHYRFVRVAEWVRRVFGVIDDAEMLPMEQTDSGNDNMEAEDEM